MSFEYSSRPQLQEERRAHRRLCILPAAMSWAFLAAFVATGLAAPSVGAALVIAFLLYYILRVAHNTLFLTLSFARVRAEERSDWLARLDDLLAPASASRRSRLRREIGGRLASGVHEDVVRSCRAAGASLPPLSRLVHVVIVPICNEKREVYEQGIRAMADGVLDPATFLIVVLAVEEWCGQEVREHAEAVRREYAHRFRDFLLLVHPAGLEGEIPGKGSNVGHAARQMAGYLRERSVDFADVLLTCVDADAVISPQYFACLSYYFLAEPNRTRACFQPLAVFSNNIWRVPAFVRVVEMGATVFQLIDSSNMDVLVTFSCYSYSFLALAESGYWPRDVIAEDAAVFWKTFLHYRGDFRAVPLPVTVRMDAAEGPTFWKTLTSMYRQKLRWAYGAENLAIVFRGLFRHRAVAGRRRWTTVLKLVDNNLTAATLPFTLSVLTWVPQVYRLLSAVTPLPVFNLGRISGVIFQLFGLFLAMIIVVTGILAYRSSARAGLWKKILYPLEWFLILPVASLVFGGAAALHAQTRLALGKPLSHVPMQKIR